MFSEYNRKSLSISIPTPDARAMKCLSLQPQGTEYDRKGFVRGEVDLKKDVEKEDRNEKALLTFPYPLQLN